jgi:hypothetical protein
MPADPGQSLSRRRAVRRVRADVNATDVIVFGAMITQPLPTGTAFMTVARRHIHLFVCGIRASTDSSLPGPAVTRDGLEAAFRAGAQGS